MKRISPLAGISVLVISLLIFVNDRNPRDEWSTYLRNHPYSSKISLKELEEMPKKDRPDLAMRQNFLMTVDPQTKTVPVERLVKAYEIQKRARLSNKDAIAGVTWVERGPNNIGGRTRALMWDPNDLSNEKLWAAGVAGGIWSNDNITDPNVSWQKVDDFMANLAVCALAYDPNNTQVFYAGTGEGYFNADAVRGAGIFKSTDAGATWTQMESTNNSTFNYIQKILVTSEGTLLVSTRDGGIQRSNNDGVSWTTVLDGTSDGAFTSRGNDLDTAANGDIYATLGIFSSGSVHRSVDDGATWTAITPTGGSPERIEVAVAASESSTTETTVLYALSSADNNSVEWFKKSGDGGDTWTDITIPNYRSQNCSLSSSDFTRGQAWYDLALEVSPTDPDVVIAGGINVVKSSDGGSTMAEVSYWTGNCDTYVHADIHNIVFRPGNPNEAVIGSDGGVSYSSNLGSAADPFFEDRNRDYNVTQFYAVAAINNADENYYLAGAQDNGTQRFTDSKGMTTEEATGGDGAFCFIDQDDSNVQISSFVYNNYYLLNGAGVFIGTLNNDALDLGRFINPADYDNASNILYSAGETNRLMRISGIGTSPNAQENLSLNLGGGQISALRADAFADNRLFIGTDKGNIFRIDNANEATPGVTDITGNMSTVGYMSSIDIGSSDDELIVTFSNYGVISVWYTADGGTTWVNKDNDASLPDIPIRWALFNPNSTQEVLLATELGVWSTSDITAGAPGWEQSSDNMANVRCDMLQYRDSDNLVVVATHGRGLYTTGIFDGLIAPTDLAIEQVDNSINLTWSDNSLDEENYIIERSIGDTRSFEIIATLDADTEAYSDAVSETNQQHFYRIYGTSLAKGDSRVASNDILSLPDTPTLTEVTNATFSEFTINWTVTDNAVQFSLDVSETDDFSSFLTGYEGRIISGFGETISDRASGTYFFRVAARNASGLSGYTETGTISLDPLSVSGSDIVYYPNPSKDFMSLMGVSPSASFELIDLLGQRISVQVRQKTDGFELDLSTLRNGSYLLKIIDGSEVTTKTIVKK